MKTIVVGKIPVETYRGTCQHCGHVLETNDKSEFTVGKNEYAYSNSCISYFVKCPTCKCNIYFDLVKEEKPFVETENKYTIVYSKYSDSFTSLSNLITFRYIELKTGQTLLEAVKDFGLNYNKDVQFIFKGWPKLESD